MTLSSSGSRLAPLVETFLEGRSRDPAREPARELLLLDPLASSSPPGAATPLAPVLALDAVVVTGVGRWVEPCGAGAVEWGWDDSSGTGGS